jgi:triosephosphate isomerase
MKKFRKAVVAGNWKMNKSVKEAVSLAETVHRELSDQRDVDVILCPPFTALQAVGEVLAEGQIKLSAQNMHWEKDGAYTGEVSAAMLRDLYCRYVILGHSERRSHFGETDEIVNRKASMALQSGLEPIICVGESLEQREADETMDVVETQLTAALAGLENQVAKIILAYEPVWAIGTGLTATPQQAQEVHAHIRSVLATLTDESAAQAVRIQYGGSVKVENIVELLQQEDIDGALVGGASLEARTFVQMVLSLSEELG